MEKPSPDETHFGYRTVPREEKAGLVKGVFDRVADRYDLMNDLMSGGLHRLWKREMVDALAPTPAMTLLDVAGGTGDIALRIRDYCQRHHGETPHITVCDINRQMLLEGRKRFIDAGILGGVDCLCADAMALPMDDMTQDAYTIAFGIRNVTSVEAALKEAYRVLKPGGHFLCLEFSHVDTPALAPLYDFYSMQVIPKIGKAVTGDGAPYQYLVESIRRFPDQQTFARMIGEAGFANVTYRNLTGGIVALHSGWRV